MSTHLIFHPAGLHRFVLLLPLLPAFWGQLAGQTLDWVNQPLMPPAFFGGEDSGQGIAKDDEGNVYVTGYFQGTAEFDPGPDTANLTSAGSADIYIAKYDNWGNYQWARRIGGTGDDIGYSIAVDGSGNVYVTGYFRGTNVDFDPGPGTATLSSTGLEDIFITKYDASGNYLWANRVGGTGSDVGFGIAADHYGNGVYVTGTFQGTNVDFDPGPGTANLTSAGSFDIFIARYDASGNYLWANRVGGTSFDIGYSIAIDDSDNSYVTGYFSGTNVDFDPGAGTANLTSAGIRDVFIAKYDASGNYLWANRVGGTSNDIGNGVAVDALGNVYATGYFQGADVDFDPGPGTANLSSTGLEDIFIAQYDASGNYLWANRVGGTGSDGGFGIAADYYGNGVYVTGTFQGTNVDFDPGPGTADLTSAGSFDIFIAAYDASGNYQCANRVGDSGDDFGIGIVLDHNNVSVHVTGEFEGTNVDFDPGANTAGLSAGVDGSDVFILSLCVWFCQDYLWAINLGQYDRRPFRMECKAIARDASGNVYATGYFQGTNVDFDPGPGTANLSSSGFSDDIFIAKYDASGNYVWAIHAGGTGNDISNALALDGSGNVYVTGYFQGTNVDFDPGPGTANLSGAGFVDIFIAKYDASGNYVWANQVGGTGSDLGDALALDGSGNVFVTGAFSGTNVDFDPGPGTANLTSVGSNDIFIAKYDATGNYLWANRMGGTSSDIGYSIAIDDSNNSYVTGTFSGTNVDFDPGAGTANLTSTGASDIFLAKYDASGNYVWANHVGGTSSDLGKALALDGSGNVCITGNFRGTSDFDPGAGTANLTSTGLEDIFIAKYDASGNYLWANHIGGTSSESSQALALDGSGNVYITGDFEGTSDFDPGVGTANLTSAGGFDIFIAKYDAMGNYLLAMQAGATGSNTGNCIAVGGSGKANVGGSFSGTVDFDPGAGIANRTAVAANGDIFIAQYATEPEINLKGNAVSIVDGDGTPAATDDTDFGNVCVSDGTNPNTFTIENTGATNLTLAAGSITITGTHAGDFALSGITLPTTIPAGNSTTFVVTFDPGALGLRTATVNIVNNDFGESPYNFAIQGTGTNTCPLNFGGTILWDLDLATGVKDATVNVTGAGSGSALTGVNGDYTVSIPYTTGNFTVKPVKNTNRLNGVTAADATAIQQHVANVVPITNPYRMIAADVNRSNSVSTLDATLINQCLLGNPSANAIFNVFWRFPTQSWTPVLPPWGFPEQINLTGVNSDQSGLNFYGVKIGDVVSTWTNPANFGAGSPLVLETQDRALEAGQEFDMQVNAGQLDDLIAFQFALAFDPGQLELLSVEPLDGLPLTLDNFGLYNQADGEIRMLWSQGARQSVAEGAALFRLHWRALQGGSKLSEVLQLAEDVLPGLSYNSALSESGVALRFTASTGVAQAEQGVALQIHPNPASSKVTVVLEDVEGAAALSVFDALGREIEQQPVEAGVARFEMELPEGQFPAGKYFVRLTTGDAVLTRVLVVQR